MRTTMTETEFRLHLNNKATEILAEIQLVYPKNTDFNTFFYRNRTTPIFVDFIRSRLTALLEDNLTTDEKWEIVVVLLDVIDNELKTNIATQADIDREGFVAKKLREVFTDLPVYEPRKMEDIIKKADLYKKIVAIFDFARTNKEAASLGYKR